MINVQAGHRIIDENGKSVRKVVNIHRLRWSGHVLCTFNEYLPDWVMLTDIGVGSKNGGIGQINP